jgi:hypothetical protein
MTEVVSCKFQTKQGDYAADQAVYSGSKHMSQMVIIYITWQGMFQNGQILLYDPNAYEYVSSMNPNVLDASNKRKVVRGGSGKMLLIPTSKYKGFRIC